MDNLMAVLVGLALPVGAIWLKLGIIFTRMGERKGISRNLALIGAFPVWALFFGLWLMTRSDARTTVNDESPDEMTDP